MLAKKKKAGIIQCLKRKYETLKARVQATRHASQAVMDMEAESDTGSLPDRLINPEEYEPVLLTTEEHTVAEATESIEPGGSKERRMLTPVYTYGSISHNFEKHFLLLSLVLCTHVDTASCSRLSV